VTASAAPGFVVAPEGRPGVYLADRVSLIAWLERSPDVHIHCLLPVGPTVIGANWPKEKVIEAIRLASRVGVMTGEARRNNLGHALAVIGPAPQGAPDDERLHMFDIDVEGALVIVESLPGAEPEGGS
jgi:hypothetical protein